MNARSITLRPAGLLPVLAAMFGALVAPFHHAAAFDAAASPTKPAPADTIATTNANPGTGIATNLREAGSEVGAFAGAEAIVVEGNRAFSRESILRALSWRVDFHAAAHPYASLNAYLEMLRTRVLAGYQQSGFIEASVTVRADAAARRIRVDVREGPRYMAGRLGIEGLPPELATRLQARLVEGPAVTRWSSSTSTSIGQAPTGVFDTPAGGSSTTVVPAFSWVEGLPARSSPAALDEMRRAVETALAGLDRHDARVRVRLVPRPGQALAELVLEVTEPGTSGVLEQIEIKGLKRDTRDALLAFLELRPGMVLPTSAPASIAQKLRSSARYLHHDVALASLADPGRFRLDLDLEEWTNAPAIGQALSARDAACLKFREWLLARDRWTHDLVATIDFAPANQPNSRVEAVLVPDGLLVTLSESPGAPDGAVSSPEPPRLAAVVSPKLFAVYSPGRQRRLTIPRAGVAVLLELSTEAAPRGSKLHFTSQVGLGWKSRTGLDQAPFEVTMDMAPVAALGLHRQDAPRVESKLEGGILTTVWKSDDDEEGSGGVRLSIEAATGRLLELIDDGEPGFRVRVRTEEGVFARRLEQLSRFTAGHRDTFDPDHAWASTLEFLASEFAALSPAWFEGGGTKSPGDVPWLPVARLLAEFDWEPVVSRLERSLNPGEVDRGKDEFPMVVDAASDAVAGQPGGLTGLLAGMVLNIGSVLWAPGSWPADLLRDGILVRNGHPDLAFRRLAGRVAAEDAGPLECLLTLIAVSPADASLASRYLEMGLAHLHPADGARDLRSLMEGDEAGAHLLRQLARRLGSISETDAANLGSAAGPAGRALLLAARTALRSRTNASPDQVLLEAVERNWTNVVELPLRAALEANPPGVADPRTPAGQFQRGLALARGEHGKPGDLPAAAPWIRRSAEGGHPEAQSVFGDLLRDGQGIDRDVGAAMRWYRKAAEQGVPHAGCRLGMLLRSVEGVERNDREAERWFRAEAKDGCGNSAFQLGLFALQGGTGGKPDWNAALPWFRRAWHLDHAPASYFIARYHSEAGRDREAVKWLERAARKGILEAQAELGDRLSDGLSPGQDHVQGCAWLRVAVQGGHRVSQVMLRRVEAALTPEQLAEAGRRADAIVAGFMADRQVSAAER